MLVAGSENVNNVVKVVEGEGGEWKTVVVASGSDFYSYPCALPSSVDGGEERSCWVEWNHPSMPWDTTSVVVDGVVVEDKGSNGQTRVSTSGELWWIGDGGGDLYGLRGYVDGKVKRIDLEDEDMKCPSFGWSAGVRSWDFLNGGEEAVVRCKNQKTGKVRTSSSICEVCYQL